MDDEQQRPDPETGTDSGADTGADSRAGTDSGKPAAAKPDAGHRKRKRTTGTGTGTGSDGGNQPQEKEASSSSDTLTIESDSSSDSTTKPTRRRTTRRKPTKKQLAEAGEAADMMLLVVETVAVELAGDDASLQPHEQLLIHDPLQRLLARVDKSTSDKYIGYIDPLLLGAGLVLYGLRVNALAQSQKPPKPQPSQGLRPTRDTEPVPGTLRQNLTPAP